MRTFWRSWLFYVGLLNFALIAIMVAGYFDGATPPRAWGLIKFVGASESVILGVSIIPAALHLWGEWFKAREEDYDGAEFDLRIPLIAFAFFVIGAAAVLWSMFPG